MGEYVLKLEEFPLMLSEVAQEGCHCCCVKAEQPTSSFVVRQLEVESGLLGERPQQLLETDAGPAQRA